MSPKSIAVGIVIVALLVLVAGGVYTVSVQGSGTLQTALADYPLCADTAAGVGMTPKKIRAKMPLSLKCESGWVSIPDGYDFRISNGSGDLEYFFWDGRRLFVSGKERKWLGDIRGQNFRLRGEGTAVIAIEPRTPRQVPKEKPRAARKEVAV